MKTPCTSAAIFALMPLLVAGVASAQVRTQPLSAVDERTARQTGVVTLQLPHDERVVVRSFEPDNAPSNRYRISFDALDANGDGFIDRKEASAHPALSAEFGAVDADRDGRLGRDELHGWLAD